MSNNAYSNNNNNNNNNPSTIADSQNAVSQVSTSSTCSLESRPLTKVPQHYQQQYVQQQQQQRPQQQQVVVVDNNNRKVVAGYLLQQKLGSGSFAVVYKGVKIAATADNNQQQQQTDLNTSIQDTAATNIYAAAAANANNNNNNMDNNAETVAIKAISRTSDKLTKKVLQNLEMEIAILQTYRHPHIVCLHSVVKTDRHFYLMLEYCGGGDLQHLIRTRQAGRLSEGLTRRLLRDLSSGLQFLWGQELIHRDIKPQNLLLTSLLPLEEIDDPDNSQALYQARQQQSESLSRSFGLKIADFGFARHLQSASLAETLCGSPLYMAPEILQHHRYDAKADLWSVGTVLFEMITGRPPFNGENHLDLLRNIQRKAVRLPPDVRVSHECVNLLRILLHRNPLGRAGFKEFLTACDAFVALGCKGSPSENSDGSSATDTNNNNNTMNTRQRMDLGTIPEVNEGGGGALAQTSTDSVMAVNPGRAMPSNALSFNKVSLTESMPIPLGPSPGPGNNNNFSNNQILSAAVRHSPHGLTPLVPSPPQTAASPLHAAMQDYDYQKQQQQQQTVSARNVSTPPRRSPDSSASAENSFVMVEYGGSTHQERVEAPAPSSPKYINTSGTKNYSGVDLTNTNMGTYQSHPNPVISSRGDYLVVRKGMLSTSPGTGCALMGMMQGPARLLRQHSGVENTERQIETQVATAAKVLAAAEDVGRRAVSVAHIGDNRAYTAMRMLVNYNCESSSSLMEGIVEEDDHNANNNNGSSSSSGEHGSGDVTDDSSSTEIMTSMRCRRRSSSATDKSMTDAKATSMDEEMEEMPFALQNDSPSPSMATGMPTRSFSNYRSGSGAASITSAKSVVKPTMSTILLYFGEALSCYLKALKMLKGSVDAAHRVCKELEALVGQRVNSQSQSLLEKVMKRCNVNSKWLASQFKGVLERADAANVEISKITNSQQHQQQQQSSSNSAMNDGNINTVSTNDNKPSKSAEELTYNYSLAFGREGAVKQLLGQLEAARSSYRTAGLLAETLLMETNVSNDDRDILNGYVDGFAARITELDALIYQQQQQQQQSTGSSLGNYNSSNNTMLYSGSRPGVVGLVGQFQGFSNLTLSPGGGRP